jgi:hypothetical protein
MAALGWLLAVGVGTATLVLASRPAPGLDAGLEPSQTALAAVVLLQVDPNRAVDPAPWLEVASREGVEVSVLRAAALDDLDLERFDALVLSEQEQLSERDVAALERLLLEGRGLVLGGRSGAIDATGRERPRGLLGQLVPSAVTRRPEGPRALPPMGALGPGPGADDLEAPARYEQQKDGGSTRRGRYGEGPVVWLPADPDPARISGALRWALRRPSVEVHAPPELMRDLRVRLDVRGPGRVEVEVVNTGGRDLRGVGARLYLPVGSGRPQTDSRGWLAAEPLVRLASDRSWLAVIESSLGPGDSARTRVRYRAPVEPGPVAPGPSGPGSESDPGSVAGSEQARPRQM